MAGPNIPTRVMMFRDFVPDRIRVFLCLLFALIFQFSGGIYLSSVSQMVGSTALMQEDIMMAGYASFVGMTVVFPILFRLKFRFTTRSILLFICPSLILCNIITMYTESLPVLVIFCFIAGVLRMWGTFEALSNVQLSITPTRDFAVFFPVVYMIVLGSIQLSGLATVYLGYWANWKYMHLFIIGLLLIMWALVAMLTHHFRFMKPMPLFGIDWLGGALWSIFLLSLIFVFEYGKFYDWYDSWQIVIGTVIAVVSLAMSIHRMLVMRHPYIELEAFKYKNLSSLLFLFLILCFFLASPNVLQNIFTGSILKYDVLNSVSLNWWNFAGTVIGCVFAYIWHASFRDSRGGGGEVVRDLPQQRGLMFPVLLLRTPGKVGEEGGHGTRGELLQVRLDGLLAGLSFRHPIFLSREHVLGCLAHRALPAVGKLREGNPLGLFVVYVSAYLADILHPPSSSHSFIDNCYQ